ncbi:putative 2og-fe oxygenase superfamily protein [Zalerion maritima]|uniref:2og-fe oxygenase superfamily protein n=1 Tax=Zalerion maritima TaxID=339359 RepID=A0AAD5RTI6_9PEZI|nr:putative 2og-fe oxygenase superfamily protein [Zalerion maritima]
MESGPAASGKPPPVDKPSNAVSRISQLLHTTCCHPTFSAHDRTPLPFFPHIDAGENIETGSPVPEHLIDFLNYSPGAQSVVEPPGFSESPMKKEVSGFRAENSKWESAFSSAIETVLKPLFVQEAGPCTDDSEKFDMAELDIKMERFVFVRPNQGTNSPRIFHETAKSKAVAKMWICLPNPHQGGELRIRRGPHERVYPTTGTIAWRTDCGSGNKQADILAAVNPVESGVLRVLVYDVSLREEAKSTIPPTVHERQRDEVAQAIQGWRREVMEGKEKKKNLVFPFELLPDEMGTPAMVPTNEGMDLFHLIRGSLSPAEGHGAAQEEYGMTDPAIDIYIANLFFHHDNQSGQRILSIGPTTNIRGGDTGRYFAPTSCAVFHRPGKVDLRIKPDSSLAGYKAVILSMSSGAVFVDQHDRDPDYIIMDLETSFAAAAMCSPDPKKLTDHRDPELISDILKKLADLLCFNTPGAKETALVSLEDLLAESFKLGLWSVVKILISRLDLLPRPLEERFFDDILLDYSCGMFLNSPVLEADGIVRLFWDAFFACLQSVPSLSVILAIAEKATRFIPRQKKWVAPQIKAICLRRLRKAGKYRLSEQDGSSLALWWMENEDPAFIKSIIPVLESLPSPPACNIIAGVFTTIHGRFSSPFPSSYPFPPTTPTSIAWKPWLYNSRLHKFHCRLSRKFVNDLSSLRSYTPRDPPPPTRKEDGTLIWSLPSHAARNVPSPKSISSLACYLLSDPVTELFIDSIIPNQDEFASDYDSDTDKHETEAPDPALIPLPDEELDPAHPAIMTKALLSVIGSPDSKFLSSLVDFQDFAFPFVAGVIMFHDRPFSPISRPAGVRVGGMRHGMTYTIDRYISDAHVVANDGDDIMVDTSHSLLLRCSIRHVDGGDEPRSSPSGNPQNAGDGCAPGTDGEMSSQEHGQQGRDGGDDAHNTISGSFIPGPGFSRTEARRQTIRKQKALWRRQRRRALLSSDCPDWCHCLHCRRRRILPISYLERTHVGGPPPWYPEGRDRVRWMDARLYAYFFFGLWEKYEELESRASEEGMVGHGGEVSNTEENSTVALPETKQAQKPDSSIYDCSFPPLPSQPPYIAKTCKGGVNRNSDSEDNSTGEPWGDLKMTISWGEEFENMAATTHPWVLLSVFGEEFHGLFEGLRSARDGRGARFIWQQIWMGLGGTLGGPTLIPLLDD